MNPFRGRWGDFGQAEDDFAAVPSAHRVSAADRTDIPTDTDLT